MSNLPPGVTDADVDRAMGADEPPDECPGCGSDHLYFVTALAQRRSHLCCADCEWAS